MNHTADVCDVLEHDARVVQSPLRNYGGKQIFEGVVSTVECFEDNSLVRTALDEPGNNRVLVIDGMASMRCALLGDMLADKAMKNGWQGIIVNGCIRDSAAITTMQLGVKALSTNPRKSIKLGAGQRDVPVEFGGEVFRPGEYVYADLDGVVITDRPLPADAG